MARRRAAVTAALAAVTALVICAEPAHAAAPSYVALATATRPAPAPAVTSPTARAACARSTPTPHSSPRLGATRRTSGPARAPRSRRHHRPAARPVGEHRLRHRPGRRQRRRLRRRAHDVRPARLAQQLHRRGRPGPGLHPHHPPRRPRPPLREHPLPRPAGEGDRRGIPPHLQRRGLQSAHLVLTHRAEPAQRDRRPINATTAERASAAGFSFADPTSRFVGHAVCDSPKWLHGLSDPIVESYHPNRTGHASAYTSTVSPYVTGATVTATPALLTTARASADRLEHQQRAHAVTDRLVTPEVVRAPDLTTPRARAAAARAGVDLSLRASIDAADRVWSARQAAELARR